jgi:hypothetical protein
MDYKSGGSAAVSSWRGERPEEPQLPLYCASAQVPIDAVAFVRVSRGALNTRSAGGAAKVFVGLAQGDGAFPEAAFPGMRRFGARGAEQWPDAASALAAWRATLQRLGESYRAGDVPVHPRLPPDAGKSPCTYCPLPVLCRIHEIAARAPQGVEGAGGAEGEDE